MSNSTQAIIKHPAFFDQPTGPVSEDGANNDQNTTGIFTIPQEVMMGEVFQYLETKDIASFGLSCRPYQALSKDKSVWKRLVKKYQIDNSPSVRTMRKSLIEELNLDRTDKPSRLMTTSEIVIYVAIKRLENSPVTWPGKDEYLERLMSSKVTPYVVESILKKIQLSNNINIYKKLAKEANVTPPTEEEYKSLDGLEEWFQANVNQLKTIKRLYLDNNKLVSIDSLGRLTALTELGLFRNQLTSIDSLSGLTTLRELDLSDNQFSSIPDFLSDLPALKKLKLSQNQLTSIDSLSGLTTLKRLYLSCNQLTSIDSLNGLIGLRELNLSCNQLTTIDSLSGLTTLRELDLSGNQFSSIPDSLMSGLPALKVLDIACNRLPDNFSRLDIKNLGTVDVIITREQHISRLIQLL